MKICNAVNPQEFEYYGVLLARLYTRKYKIKENVHEMFGVLAEISSAVPY
jgi:hypothetical protein